MELTPVKQKFVLHWGEMGARWGVNRTVAQIHALLFIADKPLNADELCDTLAVARSNVSNSLRELQSWGLIKTVHILGDRRDHFDTSKDVWSLFHTIMEERKKREFDPTLQVLRECVKEQAQDPSDAEALKRMKEVADFMSVLSVWMDEMKGLPPTTLVSILKMGAKVQKLLRSDKEKKHG